MDLSLQDLFLKLRDQREAPGVNAVKGTDRRQYLARIAGILKPEPQGSLKGLWKQMQDCPVTAFISLPALKLRQVELILI